MIPHERELLEILVQHLRLLAVTQIARVWFPAQRTAQRQAMKLIHRLSAAGLVRMERVLARPLLPLAAPLSIWRHGTPPVDFRTLARVLHARAQTAARITTIVCATTRARRLFGDSSTSGRVKLTQVTHDLQLAEVFLHYRFSAVAAYPQPRWVSEDSLPSDWPLRQRVDALLVDLEGQPLRAVEYGGDYTSERLTELHIGLASLPLSYEIW